MTTLKNKTLGKPATKKMPNNVRRARWCQYVHHGNEMTIGIGVYRTASSPDLRMITWGKNHTIQTVIDNPSKMYVWMNTNDEGDRFEEEL
jgi:hypothetical protein